MIKYILLLPIVTFYIIRDMATLLAHQDLVRGLSLFILTFLAGLFFTAWLDIAKTQTRIRKKLGKNIYDWLEESK